MKKLIAAAVATGAILGTASCSAFPGDPESPESWSETVVKLQDGRSVRCLIWSGYSRGGPSCDWANATKQ